MSKLALYRFVSYAICWSVCVYMGEGNGNPLQCSGLENPRDREAWCTAVYGVAQSQTRLKWLSSSSSSRQHIKNQRHYFVNKGPSSQAIVFPVVLYGCESWTRRKAECQRIDALNCGVGEDSWESLGLQGHPTSPFWRKSALGFLWKEWC